MPSIMVYTEETFYYTDGIRVVAREEYMRPDVTELSFYRKEGFWIGFEAPVVNSWTYYLEGSFGYIFQPTGYTGYLIELDIEDRG